MWKINTVESRFKVFPHLVFIFCSPGKNTIHAMHELPHFCVSRCRVFPHLVDENSAPTWSPYPDFVTLNPRAINCPPLVYVCYCLFKVSFRIVGQRTVCVGVHWPWETSGKEPRCVYCIHLEAASTRALRIVCSICIQICV
jgi:hypothetical protein